MPFLQPYVLADRGRWFMNEPERQQPPAQPDPPYAPEPPDEPSTPLDPDDPEEPTIPDEPSTPLEPDGPVVPETNPDEIRLPGTGQPKQPQPPPSNTGRASA